MGTRRCHCIPTRVRVGVVVLLMTPSCQCGQCGACVWAKAWGSFKQIHGSQEADTASAVDVIDRALDAARDEMRERAAQRVWHLRTPGDEEAAEAVRAIPLRPSTPREERNE